MCLRLYEQREREFARLELTRCVWSCACVCVVEHTARVDKRVASVLSLSRLGLASRSGCAPLPGRGHLARAVVARAPRLKSECIGYRAPAHVRAGGARLHLGEKIPRNSNFENPSSARGICKVTPDPNAPHAACLYLLCVPISSHCGALALCRLSLGLDQPRRLPSRDQVEVASCQSALNGLDLRRACRRIYAHPAAAPRSVLFD